MGSKKQYRQELPVLRARGPVHDLWFAVLQRCHDDLILWSENKRLHKICEDASPVTGQCTIDTYHSCLRWLCDETTWGVTFSEVCEHLDLCPDATFEALIKCLSPADRKAITLRRRRRTL